MEIQSQAEKVAVVASINDPIRRSLYDFVSHSARPVGRDAAAKALGMARSTAAFHLDKLVEEGALDVEFKRISGKTGPGSGRPAKLYCPRSGEVVVSIPERHYELVGTVLAAAIGESDRTGEPIGGVLSRVSSDTGRELGKQAGTLEAVLDRTGYDPQPDGDGGLVLLNCPFHRLVDNHPDVVCAANLGLLQGAAEGACDSTHDVLFHPGEGHCCVRIAARQ
ncbi:MAG: transcriptional regulator [Terrimesophilobacter sp.]